MKTKTLGMALTLAVLVVATSTTYVLAYPGSGGFYYGVTGSSLEDEAWWDEMRAQLEDRWADFESEDWWNEMRQYMEERWTESDNGDYIYGRYGGYGGYGGCGGMRW